MKPGTHTPLIVSGAPRSGTSLLYNLFDGHPEVAWLVLEGYLFEHLHDLGEAAVACYVEAARLPLDQLVDGIRDKDVIPALHKSWRQTKEAGYESLVDIPIPWSEDRFIECLHGFAPSTVVELWNWLAGACLAGLGAESRRFVCMKAPDYGKSAVAAAQYIPGAKAIVIVRDALYSLDSLKRSREVRGAQRITWPVLASNIQAFNDLARRVARADPERLMWLRYEDLVREPEAHMRRIADWAGIAFDNCLLEPTMLGHEWPGVSSFTPTKGIEATPAERGIKELTKEECALIERHIGPYELQFGYSEG